MTVFLGNGARGRIGSILLDQGESGFQPAQLTDAILPSPARQVSNLGGMIPGAGIELRVGGNGRSTTAHEDQYAPEPASGPTCGECANFNECCVCFAEVSSNLACEKYAPEPSNDNVEQHRKVRPSPDTLADSDGDDGA
jgi:hypothetical protein